MLFRSHNSARATWTKPRIGSVAERKLHDLDPPISAVKRQLPSKEKVAQAEAERTKLLKELRGVQDRYHKAWTKLLEAVDELGTLEPDLTKAANTHAVRVAS